MNSFTLFTTVDEYSRWLFGEQKTFSYSQNSFLQKLQEWPRARHLCKHKNETTLLFGCFDVLQKSLAVCKSSSAPSAKTAAGTNTDAHEHLCTKAL